MEIDKYLQNVVLIIAFLHNKSMICRKEGPFIFVNVLKKINCIRIVFLSPNLMTLISLDIIR